MRPRQTERASPATRATAKHLGLLVREARLARRWSLVELAERARVSLATTKRVEAGSLAASLGTWLSLLERLGLLHHIAEIRDPTSAALLDATRVQRARKRVRDDLDF